MDRALYDIPARRIAGTHEEKLDQLDAAIQELLALKVRECGNQPGVRFLAAPARSHWVGMTVTLALLLVMLLLIEGTW